MNHALMKALPVSEADVLKQVKTFMSQRGWRWYRMDVGGYSRPEAGYREFGEKGVPDLLCVYYLREGKCFLVWIEVKSPKDRGRCTCRPFSNKLCRHCGQAQWRKIEEARGGLVLQISDLRELIAWYDATFGWLHGESGPRPGQTSISFADENEQGD